jgi:ABC-type glutathione transport system ATPase component
MSRQRDTTALVVAGVAAGAAIGAAATYAWLRGRTEVHAKPDVEVFERHNGPPSNRSKRGSGTCGAAGSASAVSGSDVSNPMGDAVLATEGQSDPSGARRKLSVDGRRGPVIIGVAGASGSGKTSIAELLAERLSCVRVTSISSDLYYKSMPRGTDAGEYNFDQ